MKRWASPQTRPVGDHNRHFKISCPCGYKLRGSRFQLARGIPNCPICDVQMTREVPQ